jgi:galactitol-specific phosphotransferase system IIB component
MKYITNFTRGCFFNWTASKAIAEFVQNWLDSDGERDCYFGDDTIVLTNMNIKVSNKLLLMGCSDKRNDSSKRGMHGVGSTQAMVVLTDLDYTVTIKNNDVVWTPSWEYCDKFNADVMVITEFESYSPDNNFTVTITGLDSGIIDEVKQRCLAFQDRDVLYSTKYGDIIETINGQQGEIYVGDLYVCQNSAFSYSYNFKPEYVKLCQDRNLISQWDIQELTSKLIIATEDVNFIKEAITAATTDTRNCNVYSSYGSQATSDEVNDKIATEFLEEHGAVLVTDDYCKYQEMIKLGNKAALITNSTQYKAITRSKVYEEAIAEVEEIQKESFEDLFEQLFDNVVYMLDNAPRQYIPEQLSEQLEVFAERVRNREFD